MLTSTTYSGRVNQPSHFSSAGGGRQTASQPFSPAVSTASLDTVGINGQRLHNHRSRNQRRRNKKRKYFQPLKDPSIRKTKDLAALKLRAAGYPDLAAKLDRCGRHQLVKICRTCEQSKKPCVHGLGHHIDPCGLWWLCPDCARSRALRTQKRLLPKVRKFAAVHHYYRPVFITLTVKSGFDLEERRRVLMDSFKRLRKRDCWKNHIAAAISSLETSFNSVEGYHPHFHIIAFRKAFWEQDDLCWEWSSATKGEGCIADIRDVTGDLRDAMAELLKYVTKPMDIQKMGPDELHQFVFLKGRHMLLTLGKLRGFRLSKVDMKTYGDGEDDLAVCSQCGEPLSQVMACSFALERVSQSVVVRGP